MVSAELQEIFGVHVSVINVYEELLTTSSHVWSTVTFKLGEDSKLPMPVIRINKAMPYLKQYYDLIEHDKNTRKYRSKQKWTVNNKSRAEKFHFNNLLKLTNYGAHYVNYNMGSMLNKWHFGKNGEILPTLSGTLIFSFVLSSLSRYRANIINYAEKSKLNLLFDVFTTEADYYMIPAIRNLLYCETVAIHQI